MIHLVTIRDISATLNIALKQSIPDCTNPPFCLTFALSDFQRMYGEVADKFDRNEFGHLSECESGTKYRSTGSAESMVEGEPTKSVNN